jgi:hypothetical protein
MGDRVVLDRAAFGALLAALVAAGHERVVGVAIGLSSQPPGQWAPQRRSDRRRTIFLTFPSLKPRSVSSTAYTAFMAWLFPVLFSPMNTFNPSTHRISASANGPKS